METYCLYSQAAFAKNKALSILTSVYDKNTDKGIPSDAKALTPMVQTALSLV
jgi:purine-nucleoside phosphorylase